MVGSIGLILVAVVGVVSLGTFITSDETASIQATVVDEPSENATVYDASDPSIAASETLRTTIGEATRRGSTTTSLSDEQIDELDRALESLEHHSGTTVDERGYYFEQDDRVVRVTTVELLSE